MSTFTPSGSAGLSPTITIPGSTAPTVSLVLMVLAATEYSIPIPIGTRQFQVKLRDPLSLLQCAYVPGDSGTTFLTVPRGCFYAESELLTTSSLILYFQSPSAGQTLEVLLWT